MRITDTGKNIPLRGCCHGNCWPALLGEDEKVARACMSSESCTGTLAASLRSAALGGCAERPAPPSPCARLPASPYFPSCCKGQRPLPVNYAAQELGKIARTQNWAVGCRDRGLRRRNWQSFRGLGGVRGGRMGAGGRAHDDNHKEVIFADAAVLPAARFRD